MAVDSSNQHAEITWAYAANLPRVSYLNLSVRAFSDFKISLEIVTAKPKHNPGRNVLK